MVGQKTGLGRHQLDYTCGMVATSSAAWGDVTGAVSNARHKVVPVSLPGPDYRITLQGSGVEPIRRQFLTNPTQDTPIVFAVVLLRVGVAPQTVHQRPIRWPAPVGMHRPTGG